MSRTITAPQTGDRLLTASHRDPVEVREVVPHITKTGAALFRCRVAMPSGAERWTTLTGVAYDTADTSGIGQAF